MRTESKINNASVHSVFRRIRVKKADSAFVNSVLESHDGVASYSTLDFHVGDLYRDLELRIPPTSMEELDEILTSLGDLVYEIDENGESIKKV